VIEPYIGARGLGDSVRALDSTIEQLWASDSNTGLQVKSTSTYIELGLVCNYSRTLTIIPS
jgi:hypothetical protein